MVGIARRGDRFTVRLSSGQSIVARAVVLATGASPGTDWAPDGLSGADVADPWTDELPDGDLLLVGTGLTMVDVAIAADRPGRTLHTVSRHDLVPAAHRMPTTPLVPPPPGITRIGTLDELKRVVDAHVERTVEETGDWRAAIDGLRPVTAQLWQGLGDEDKRRFVERARSRLGDPPAPDVAGDRGPAGRDRRQPADSSGTPGRSRRPGGTGTGLEVTLTDGSQIERRGSRQLHGSCRDARQGPAARLAGTHRPGPSRPVGTGHRHRGRRTGARRTPGQDAVLRPRFAATRQPVGDHGDARDPRAGVRRGALRRTRAARRDPAPAGRRLRPHPDDRPQGSGLLQPGARTPAPVAGRRRGRPRGGHGAGPRVRAGTRCPGTARARVGRRRLLAQLAECSARRSRGPPPRRPRGQLPGRGHGSAPLGRAHRCCRPAPPRPALPQGRPRRERGRADRRVRRPHLRQPDVRPGRGPRQELRRRLVVRRTAGLRAPGPGAMERGRVARLLRPVGRAVVRARGARADPRVLRDGRARGRVGVARRVDPHPRARGQPPLTLLLARRPPRADAVRHRRGPAPLRTRARATAGDRFARAGRQRSAAVAPARDRRVGGRASEQGGLRLGAGRLADHSPDGVRCPALGPHPGRGVRRGRPVGAPDDLAGPRRPVVP